MWEKNLLGPIHQRAGREQGGQPGEGPSKGPVEGRALRSLPLTAACLRVVSRKGCRKDFHLDQVVSTWGDSRKLEADRIGVA